MKRIAIHFARLGPYHVARMEAAAEVLGPMGWHVVALEAAGKDSTYLWEKTAARHSAFERRTVFKDRVCEEISASELKREFFRALDELQPHAVAVAGWGTADARACLSWCKSNGVRAIVMSETRAADGRRVWWREWIKSRIVRKFDGALCGGESHRQYLIHLGMPEERISLGYNVVDNQFFSKIQNEKKFSAFSFQFSGSGGETTQTRAPYFLASNRFVERKNLARLIRAYAKYVESFQFSAFSVQESGGGVWPLVLLGDGELREELVGLCEELAMKVFSFQDSVFSREKEGDLKLHSYKLKTPAGGGLVVFAGFRQVEELPAFYAGAGAFVHPALEEPWGLVINEAMASGLPVISSRNVGAAEELVAHGKTGFLFDPVNIEELSQLMTKVAGMPLVERQAMGVAGAELLEKKAPQNAFGKGLSELLKKFEMSSVQSKVVNA